MTGRASKSGQSSQEKKNGPPDYNEYRLRPGEWLRLFLSAALRLGLIVYTFYKSRILFLCLLPLAAVYPFFRRKALRDIRKHRLLLEFREALSVLASYLGAGYSTENAFRATVPELGRLLGPDALIVREFRWISQGLGLHRPLEELLLDFAGRSGVDDIGNFAEVFSVAKRSGGELVRIISHTASVIRDKVSIEEEIVTMNSAKRYEQKIMNFMPFGIILYMNLSSPDFFRMLYTSFLGRIVMTGCLLVWCLAVWLADRIMDIEV